MSNKYDSIISKFFLIPAVMIVLYWIVRGVIWLYGWFVELPSYSTEWWVEIGSFCLNNLSIIVVIYIFMCLQVSGLAEFKFRKNFVKAFLLGLVMTPPVMIAVWGRKKES